MSLAYALPILPLLEPSGTWDQAGRDQEKERGTFPVRLGMNSRSRGPAPLSA